MLMKKPCFHFNVPPPAIWIIVHVGIFLSLGISVLLYGPVGINTNFFDILPPSPGLKAATQADKALGDTNSRRAIVLAASRDFAEAREGARELHRRLSHNSAFESMQLYVDAELIKSFSDFLYEYRFALLDDETRGLLESGRATEIADSALASAYGAFTFSSLDYLDGDPFFLTERELRAHMAASLASAPSVSVREDVLAARHDELWYVMLRLTLSPGGASLNGRDSAVKKIYAECDAISDEFADNGGLRFVYSGAPFHSYESSTSAQREITIIATVTSTIVIILFLLCLRSVIPIAASVAAAGLSVLTALASALLFFREVHVLTFVFGTTLIGTCVDYSIHYFIHWKRNPFLNDGVRVRSFIFRGISMSFISTCVCFLLLLFAPFAILRQFAVFSLSGMVSSYLTVNCIFPLIKKPASVPSQIFKPSRPIPRRVRLGLLALFAIIFVVLLGANRRNLRIENNIRSLYTMQGKLLESEKTAAAVLDTGSMGWYYLVSGKSPGETLENEERLRAALDVHITLGNLGNYTAVSMFIPSIKTQERNIRAAENLLPLAQVQYAALGFSSDEAELFAADLANARRVDFDTRLPPFLEDIVSALWIGRGADGLYYSAVFTRHAAAESVFRTIAETQDGVLSINKVDDIGTTLNRLTLIIALLFLVSYVVIAVIVRLNYSLKKTARICLVPFFLVLVPAALLSCLKIPFGFFPAVGMILVFGLGLDYIFYITETESAADTPPDERAAAGSSLTILAIALSYATTALSFGALALSGFVPVKLFGLTVFAGLSAAFIAAMLVTGGNARNGSGRGSI